MRLQSKKYFYIFKKRPYCFLCLKFAGISPENANASKWKHTSKMKLLIVLHLNFAPNTENDGQDYFWTSFLSFLDVCLRSKLILLILNTKPIIIDLSKLNLKIIQVWFFKLKISNMYVFRNIEFNMKVWKVKYRL